jgi:surfactin synthase thioesterase subunit
MSDNGVMKTLKKAGLSSEADDNGNIPFSLENFRRHTEICNGYFCKKTKRTDVALTALISRNDPFTKSYADAKALWQKVVTEVVEVVLIDTPSHYFHNTDTGLMLNMFSEINF